MVKRVTTWVVYEALERGKPCGTHAVCDASEWTELEKARPGGYPLIRAGITSEAEAEQLARATTALKNAK
ncbi:MAG: hypothetical protein ACJ8C4_02010 [Gemmataceae bacterium]